MLGKFRISKKRPVDDSVALFGKEELSSIFFNVFKDTIEELSPDHPLCEDDSWWKKAKLKPMDKAAVYGMQEDEKLIWKAINKGYNVLISGSAGHGKSVLLRNFEAHCKMGEFVYSLTAPTGVAALNIGGETLHRALGLGLAKDSVDDYYQKLNSRHLRQYYQKTLKFLKETKVLIIDEISMVHRKFFDKLDCFFRKFRNNNIPFGGVRLVLVGDFCQLPPIHKSEEVNYFSFQSEAWQRMKWCRIFKRHNYRQESDDGFQKILKEVRMGQLTEESRQALQERADTVPRGFVLSLYPHREDTDSFNMKYLNDNFEDEIHKIRFKQRHQGRDPGTEPSKDDMKKIEYLYNNPDKLDGHFPIGDLNIAVGCEVMLRCNTYFDLGYCNGSIAKVVDMILPNKIQLQFFGPDRELLPEKLMIERYDYRTSVGGNGCIIRNQFPLSLAYASTIHKTQGLTINAIKLKGSPCFEAHQFSVAISRVRTLEDLYFENFNEESIKSNPDCVRFETAYENYIPTDGTKVKIIKMNKL